MPIAPKIRIAARQSLLARTQAEAVGMAIREHFPKLEIEYYFRESLGDADLNSPLWQMATKGVFTEDFVEGLVKGEFDAVVHSWKDLPIEDRVDTKIVATLAREDPRDALLLKKEWRHSKKHRLRLYTSSPRRVKNLKPFLEKYIPLASTEIHFSPVRGNIQTRVTKTLQAGEIDGLVIAKAALDRLKLDCHEFDLIELPLSENPTAAAQGALAIEIRRDRKDLDELFKSLNCRKTWDDVTVERQILREHGGGCHLALGISAQSLPWGQVVFIRGETSREPIAFKPTNFQAHRFAPENLLKGSSLDLFDREQLSLSLEDREKLLKASVWFIAKAHALSVEAEALLKMCSPRLFTAGLSSWRKLAEREILVSGCDDGLGERHLDEKTVKLTHLGALKRTNDIATYRLLPRQISTDIFSKARACYWQSGSQFEQALNLFPNLIAAEHSSGPGQTARRIAQLLGPAKTVAIFPNEETWWKTLVKNKDQD